MATDVRVIFTDKEKGNRVYMTVNGIFYGYDKKNNPLDLNNMILTVESAGFDINRIEKSKGDIKLVLEDEVIANELDMGK